MHINIVLIFNFIFSFLFLSGISAQEKETNYYQLGEYQIYPQWGAVFCEQMVGGSDGKGMQWDGYIYIQDTTIHYNSTALIFYGKNVSFKEKFLTKIKAVTDENIDDLKILYSDILSGKTIYRLKNTIYIESYEPKTIDVTEFTRINEFLYKDSKGTLYYFNPKSNKFESVEVSLSLDIPTLSHLSTNHYYDKNGLYIFGFMERRDNRFVSTIKQLEQSNGQKIIPFLGRDYFIYGDYVYSTDGYSYSQKLDLDGLKIREIPLEPYSKTFMLTDGDKTYKYSMGFKEKFTSDSIQLQKQLSTLFQNSFIEKDNNLYFSAGKVKAIEGKYVQGTLIETNKGGLLLDGNNEKMYDTVFIYNIETQKYEKLDTAQYKCLSRGGYIYKKTLFTYSGVPVEDQEQINLEKLKPVLYKYHETDYYTDGNILYCSHGGQIVEIPDAESLKVVDLEYLIGNQNIYYIQYKGVNVIPRDKLCFPIKIFQE